MDIQKLILTLHPLERKVLPHLGKFSDFQKLLEATKLQEVEVMRALQWLKNKNILDIKETSEDLVCLDTNGQEYLKKGLPEKRFLQTIEQNPLGISQITEKAKLEKEEISVSIGVLKSKSAILFSDGKIAITEAGKKLLKKDSIEDALIKKISQKQWHVNELKDEEKLAFSNLLKRKGIIKTDAQKTRIIELTQLGKQIIKEKIESDVVEALTPEMLSNGSWKNKSFRRYDINARIPSIYVPL